MLRDGKDLETLLAACLERPVEQWEAAVEELCRQHPERADRLRSALATLRSSELGREPGDEEPIEPPPGFSLVRRLGAGGMGLVYLAEQTAPVRRHVAIKFLRPGLGSAAYLKRFERERQVVAVMEHDNIARVLDAGYTAAGLPYTVMEYVLGMPITEYCDDHRLRPRANASSS